MDGNEGRATFAGAVREARRARHWSQEALAKAARVSEKTVRRVESGEVPSVETVLSLSAALDIAPDSFEATARDPRMALPSEGGKTDEMRRVLAGEAAAGSTVTATDTHAYLRAKVGLDDEAARRWLGKATDIGKVSSILALACVLGCLMGTVGFCLVTHDALATGLGLLAASAVVFAMAFRWHVSQWDALGRRHRIEAALGMRRTVFSLSRDRLVVHALERDGTVSATSFPLGGAGHSVRHEGQDHLTLDLALLDGKAELPFIPRTPAVETFVARLALAA